MASEHRLTPMPPLKRTTLSAMARQKEAKRKAKSRSLPAAGRPHILCTPERAQEFGMKIVRGRGWDVAAEAATS
jgi:hypothetical protein